MATLDTSVIPLELAERPQWLVWKLEPGEKKPKKMPYYVSGRRRSGTQGSDDDRAELVTLAIAVARLGQGGYTGVGFAFLPGDGLIGVDIDGCIDAAGVVAPRAAAIIEACASYTEFSPSGTGVHIIVAGQTKTFKSNDIGLEVFCAAQFFTFTASPFPGTPDVIAAIDPAVLNRLRATVHQARAGSSVRTAPSMPVGMDERAKLESALACISADVGYREWIHVGMAIQAALGDGGLGVWDYWSQKSAKYGGLKELEGHWKSFGGSGAGGITAATIYKMAVDEGWRPPRSSGSIAPRASGPSMPSDALPPTGEFGEGFPAPLPEPEAPVMSGVFTLAWALAHCALVQGTTDVWDSLNKLRMKRPAFIDMLGKKASAEWAGHAERRSISPRSLPRTIRGVAVDDGDGGADSIVMMLDRYTLLYGTKTVWDAEKRTIVAYDAMSLARGSDLSTRWLEHRMRREIDLNKLVFDPTQQVDLDTHINMFGGLPLQPKKDDAKASLAVDLLKSLCSGEGNTDALLHWVLCWLAFPLQHPGAKMQTAILFFGEKQGTGKSLFFEGIVKPIFGEYGATGGQHQLDAPYTQWRSQKLFVLFEEILSRQDKYSHFGLIKHMITGRDQQVTQKFKDDRAEDNHMNVVMLSNEFQAVPIEPNDRRFLVNEATTPLDEGLRLAIKHEIDAGPALSEAFYAFLLEYPLGDFDAHTKPLMTASKERMINFGRPDWEAFYLTWEGGELSVPYCSCLSEDLYVIYARYCNRFGFRAMSWTKFAELIAQRVKKDRQWVTIGSASKRLLTVFHVPQPEGEEKKTLSQQCDTFRNLAEIKGMV